MDAVGGVGGANEDHPVAVASILPTSQRLAAVSAFENAGEKVCRILHGVLEILPFDCHKLIGSFPNLSGNKPFMGVPHDDPFTLICFRVLLCLEDGFGASIGEIAAVNRVSDQVPNGFRPPDIPGILRREHLSLIEPSSGMVNPGWAGNLVLPKIVSDPVITPTLEDKIVDLHDIGSGFRVRNPVILVRRVFQVAIRRDNGMVLSLLCPCPEGRLDFHRRITAVKLVDGSFQRSINGALLVFAVKSVVDSDIMDLMGGKIDFGILSRLDMIPSEPRQVLGDNGSDLAKRNIIDHSLEVRPVKVQAGIAIIDIKLNRKKVVLLCILGKDRLLGLDGEAFAAPFIVFGKAAVKRCDLRLRGHCLHPPCCLR